MRRSLAVGLLGVPLWLCLCAPPAPAQSPARLDHDDAARQAIERGRFDEAAQAYRKGLEFAERMGLEKEGVSSRTGLANVLVQLGQCAEAEQQASRAVKDAERFFGPDAPEVSFGLFALATAQAVRGKNTEAETLFRRCLAIQERVYGGESLFVGHTLLGVADNLSRLRRYDDAKTILVRSLTITEKAEGPDHPHVAEVLTRLAWVESVLKRLDEADRLLTRARAIHEKAGGPDSTDDITRFLILAEVRYTREKPGESEDLLKRAVALSNSLFGPDHPGIAGARLSLALICANTNRFAEAETHLKRALAAQERSSDPDETKLASVLDIYARVLRHVGRKVEAKAFEARMDAIRTKMTVRSGPVTTALRPFPAAPRPERDPAGPIDLSLMRRLWTEWGADRVVPWLRLGRSLASASPTGALPSAAVTLACEVALRTAKVSTNRLEPALKASADHRRARSFRIPYKIDENDRHRVRSIKLFVSRDWGESWRLVEEITPDEPVFHFSATANGLYWFAIQSVDKDGRKGPDDLAELEPALVVVVDGEEPSLSR